MIRKRAKNKQKQLLIAIKVNKEAALCPLTMSVSLGLVGFHRQLESKVPPDYVSRGCWKALLSYSPVCADNLTDLSPWSIFLIGFIIK